MAITIYIVYKGIGGGIEKYCRVLMPALFVLLLILIVRSVTLPGAGEYQSLSEAGLQQAHRRGLRRRPRPGILLTLPSGWDGEYLRKLPGQEGDVLPGAAMQVCFLDTMVAFGGSCHISRRLRLRCREPGAGPA